MFRIKSRTLELEKQIIHTYITDKIEIYSSDLTYTIITL